MTENDGNRNVRETFQERIHKYSKRKCFIPHIKTNKQIREKALKNLYIFAHISNPVPHPMAKIYSE